MRCYHHGGDAEFHHAVSFAEHLSSYICEECGRAGTQNPPPEWIKPLCKECRQKKEETSRRMINRYTRLKRVEKITPEELGIPDRRPQSQRKSRDTKENHEQKANPKAIPR